MCYWESRHLPSVPYSFWVKFSLFTCNSAPSMSRMNQFTVGWPRAASIVYRGTHCKRNSSEFNHWVCLSQLSNFGNLGLRQRLGTQDFGLRLVNFHSFLKLCWRRTGLLHYPRHTPLVVNLGQLEISIQITWSVLINHRSAKWGLVSMAWTGNTRLCYSLLIHFVSSARSSMSGYLCLSLCRNVVFNSQSSSLEIRFSFKVCLSAVKLS